MKNQDLHSSGAHSDWPYEDIVNLPHHVSGTRPQMAMEKRAAQFAPFAALTGYDDTIDEAGRLTDVFHEPDEDVLLELNRTLRKAEADRSEVTIIWFEPDPKKAGGKYVSSDGVIKKIGDGCIILESGEEIPLGFVSAATLTDDRTECQAPT